PHSHARHRALLPPPHLFFASPRYHRALPSFPTRRSSDLPIGIRDNFFELGGHSMLGVRLFAQMEKHFGKKLPLASLFQAPTVEQLAALLREKKTLSSCSSLVSIQPKGIKPPIFFVHGAGGGNLWTYANLAPHLGPSQPVYGLEPRRM